MTQGINKRELYELLVDTLMMISPNLESATDDDIDGYLEELEGDYYTFLDLNAITPLREADLLTDQQVENITQLKAFMNTIAPSLWNISSFKKDVNWLNAREQANDILKSLNIIT